MVLIDFLAAKQRDLRLSDVRFAEHLGIDKGTYSLWKHDRLRPGRKLLEAVIAKFPDDGPGAVTRELEPKIR